MTNSKHIVIIGGGFCGTMTAVNLIREAKSPLKITLINSVNPIGRGVAFHPFSEGHLLNVPAGNMSAFPDDTAHFVNWVHTKDEYKEYEKDLLARTFLPRNVYGEYIRKIWKEILASKKTEIEINELEGLAVDLEIQDNGVKIILENNTVISGDYTVLATGNSLPANPPIKNMDYYSSPTYFQNPWSIDSVNNIPEGKDVLIIGNGLTMVDSVIGLTEHHFKGKIYSLSPNGFGVLSHRHLGTVYSGLVAELKEPYQLKTLVPLLNKHIKKVRKLGLSAGPVIDSLRPYSQKIWRSFTAEDKKKFMKHFRHLWGVARHRLPINMYDFIQELKLEGKLTVYSGKLTDITESGGDVQVHFHNSKTKANQTLHVGRVINCTGPESHILKSQNILLKKLAEKGIISPDELKLGINTDISSYRVINAQGEINKVIFTLGSNLRGMLWESVAVPELRVQSKEVAITIVNS